MNSVDNNNLSVDIHVGGGWRKFNFARATQGCNDTNADHCVSYVSTDLLNLLCNFGTHCTGNPA